MDVPSTLRNLPSTSSMSCRDSCEALFDASAFFGDLDLELCDSDGRRCRFEEAESAASVGRALFDVRATLSCERERESDCERDGDEERERERECERVRETDVEVEAELELRALP